MDENSGSNGQQFLNRIRHAASQFSELTTAANNQTLLDK